MKQYTFSSDDISAASSDRSETAAFLRKAKVDEKEILKLTLMLEEILLTYRDRFGEEAAFRIKCTMRFRRPRIELEVTGQALDPFEQEDDETRILYRLTTNFGMLPVWQYKNSRNIIVFMPQKAAMSQTKKIFAGAAAGILTGLACLLLPEGARSLLSDQIVSPLTDTFMGLLSAVSCPLIFLSILNSIGEMGDMQSFGKIGKKTVSRLSLSTLVLGLLTLFIMLPFFGVHGGSSASFDGSSLYAIILDIVPHNFFQPFVEGNPLQIIFIAIILGITLLLLGSKACGVSALTVQLGYIINLIMEGLSAFMPLFIFGILFDMIVSGSISTILGSYHVLLIILLATVLLIPVTVLRIALRRKISPILFIRKALPVFLIALTTASSSAAFSTNVETCEKQYGLDRKLVNFGIPLGQIILMPSHVAMYLGIVLSQALAFGVTITPSWLVIAFVSSFILAVATPPVMGGSFVVFSTLFLQLGIPVEAVGLAAMMSIILDFPATAVNMLCLQGELIGLGGSLEMLDEDVLHKSMVDNLLS